VALVEIDHWAAATLRMNRPSWDVFGPDSAASSDPSAGDVHAFDARPYEGRVDLLAGGVPCPPFSKAGKQLGSDDERDLFPEALRIVAECKPRAVMLENVRGLLDPKFARYRQNLERRLRRLGYSPGWKLLQASDFRVPQLRPRTLLVALREDAPQEFNWPRPSNHTAPTVGEALKDLMADAGWELADEWSKQANRIAPTLVGGSKKHGGPDLGPTRAKREWAQLGVDGLGIADAPPPRGFLGAPRLTVRMAARLQGFPDRWEFAGRKTAAYRQVGNAFPPPVARAVARAVAAALGSPGRAAPEEYTVHRWQEAVGAEAQLHQALSAASR